MPSQVTFGNGNRIEYEYAANGTKLRTVHVTAGVTTTTDYCGNSIYENGVLKTLLNEAGYMSFPDKKFHFYLKDHQGNVRVVADKDGNVEETNAYYPFGGTFTSTSNVQPYKYNGKELDTKNGLDWYDYGARHYDAAIGRWCAMDPLAEKYYFESPSIYCANNPIKFIDPTGMSYDGYSVDEDGYIKRVNNEGGNNYDVLYNKDKYSAKTTKDYDTTGDKTGIKISKGILGEKGNMSAKQIISPIMTSDGHETGKKIVSHSYGVKSDKESLAVMNFLDKNTNVEWGNTYMKNGQGEPMNVLTTSHEEGKIRMGSIHNRKYLNNGYQIFRDDHIHPGKGYTIPSDKDRDNAANIVKDHPKAVFRILNNGRYYVYTKDK